jgi:hypothetical protein
MPFPYELFTMLLDHRAKLRQLVRLHTVIIRERHGLQPEFAGVVVTADVNMGRLAALVAVEVKSKALSARFYDCCNSIKNPDTIAVIRVCQNQGKPIC